MNKTQERVTKNFTVGHAHQTIKSILEQTEREIRKEESQKGGDLEKLRHLRVKLTNVEYLLNDLEQDIRTIDDRKMARVQDNDMGNEYIVRSKKDEILCRVKKADYETDEKAKEVALYILKQLKDVSIN